MGIGDDIIGDGPIGDAGGGAPAPVTPDHFAVLKLLYPADLGGVFDQDITIEARQLDLLLFASDGLMIELFPDTAYQTIAEWERRYGIIPDPGSTLDQRRRAVVQRKRLRKRMDVRYFIDLAATVGYTIDIEEVGPNDARYGGTDDTIHVWIVHVPAAQKQGLTQFTAGDSYAGDSLQDWPVEATLEQIIMDHKPAHTQVYFLYE